MNDNQSPRRAAQAHLAQQLPSHGRHAGPHDIGTTLGTTVDGKIVYPGVPERTGNVVEAKLADNVQRRGTVQASEGLAQRDGGGVEQMFAGGFADARSASAPVFEKKIANGRSGLADGHDSGNPTWSTDNVMRSYADFAGSAMELSPLPGNVPALRPGSTRSTMTDLSRLDLTERGRTSYGYVFGSDVKNPRRNEAEVND